MARAYQQNLVCTDVHTWDVRDVYEHYICARAYNWRLARNVGTYTEPAPAILHDAYDDYYSFDDKFSPGPFLNALRCVRQFSWLAYR